MSTPIEDDKVLVLATELLGKCESSLDRFDNHEMYRDC